MNDCCADEGMGNGRVRTFRPMVVGAAAGATVMQGMASGVSMLGVAPILRMARLVTDEQRGRPLPRPVVTAVNADSALAVVLGMDSSNRLSSARRLVDTVSKVSSEIG